MARRIPIHVADEGVPYVSARAVWTKKSTDVTVSLLLDTGAFDVALSQDSAERLGADIHGLRRMSYYLEGIGSTLEAFEMPDVALVFLCEDGGIWSPLPEPVHVIGNPEESDNDGSESLPPDILGCGFMKRHHLAIHLDLAERQGCLEIMR